MNAKTFVSTLFDDWEKGDSAPFFEALATDVIWTTKGTTSISGRFVGKQAYFDRCHKPLHAIFSGPTRCRVGRILNDGDTVVVEWHGETPTAVGVLYT